MYDAGAAPYFDIMAMQDYGLWSGPSDRRMQPRVMNFGRPQFVRDLMVANGDAHKPIWISEMGWNAVPDDVPDKRFGQVTLGAAGALHACRATSASATSGRGWASSTSGTSSALPMSGRSNRRPEAYFRLADPDFTLQPVYNSLKAYLTSPTAPQSSAPQR